MLGAVGIEEGVEGLVGHVTVRIRGPKHPGEVQIKTRGGTETFIAYGREEIARHTQVVVYHDRGARSVDVVPFDE